MSPQLTLGEKGLNIITLARSSYDINALKTFIGGNIYVSNIFKNVTCYVYFC